MNPNPIKVYFQQNFDKALCQLGILDSEAISFCIYTTNQIENYTTSDDIYRMWATPSFTGIRIKYSEVIENLVRKHKNTIPLWIKISKSKNSDVILEISQRFRNKKQIMERSSKNNIAPFEIKENSELVIDINNERKEAIRILFFKQILDKNLNSIIQNQIKHVELIEMFSLHFEKYRFYPALYNHFKKDDERYSNLVIDKDFKTKHFKIHVNNEQCELVKDNLDFDSAINYYLENELNWEYKGIRIIK